MDNPILKYMQEAFDAASPEMNENDKIPDEFKERDLAAVGYIGPVFLYSLIKNSGSELVKYHAKQSAMLLVMHMLNGVIGVVPYVGKPVKKLNTASCKKLCAGSGGSYRKLQNKISSTF